MKFKVGDRVVLRSGVRGTVIKVDSNYHFMDVQEDNEDSKRRSWNIYFTTLEIIHDSPLTKALNESKD